MTTACCWICFSDCESVSHAYCVPFATSQEKIFSELMASRTPHLYWLWYMGWFVDSCTLSLGHAGFQALWKNYIGWIWDLSPSPNKIHVLGCSYWDLPMGADSCIQCTGNILKLAVKKIEQSMPSREENRWLGTWQWWPAGCFWWMLSHWFLSLISSSCSIHTAESLLATTTCVSRLYYY